MIAQTPVEGDHFLITTQKDFFDVVKERHSIRRFSTTPVEPDKLDAILDAARRAPSAGNLQAYEIYLAREASLRASLAKASLSIRTKVARK